jgi:Ca2+-binding EF-hand superfamily protein
MPSIFDIFQSQLGEGQLDQIAKQIGADKSQTRDAIAMTLPTMIEALARQVEKQGGAEKVHSQLNQTRTDSGGSIGTGSMLDQLGEILQQESGGPAAPTARSSANSHSPVVTVHDEILPPGMSASQSKPNPNPQTSSRPQSSPQRTGPSPIDIFGELFGNKQGRVADAVSKSSGIGSSQAGSLMEILGPLLSGALAKQTQSGSISSKDLGDILKQDRARVQQSPGGGMLGKLLDQDGDGDFDMNDMLKLGMSMFFKK